jgi:hypothetical protein
MMHPPRVILLHLAVAGEHRSIPFFLKLNTLMNPRREESTSDREIVKSDARDSNYIFQLDQRQAKSIVRCCAETFLLLRRGQRVVSDAYSEARY